MAIKTFFWNDIINSNSRELFPQATGISVGSFDGLHLGHRELLNALVDGCRKKGLKSGVITFLRPLPSIKHSGDYKGDVSTLNQRLKLFESLGIDFAVLVDFNEAFAGIAGADFLNILLKSCNMKLLAEGIDFRCGYKGATDAQAIKYWAGQNNVECIFVDPVYYREGTDEDERVSSSYIRQMIQKGFFATVEELLARPYELDLTGEAVQVLPRDGLYRTESEKNEYIRLEIKDGKILNPPECKSVRFL